MSFIVKKRQGPHGTLIIITDKDILGKKFEEGRLQLDLTLDFYKGEEMEAEDIKKLIKGARHLHLTGESAVKLGVSIDAVNPDKILRVQNVPHAEVVMEA